MADAHQALADALDQCPGLEPSVRRHLHEAFIPDALLGAGLLPLVDLADRLTTCTLAADRLAPGLIRRMAPPGSAGSPPDSPAPQQVPQPLGATTTDHLVASILGLLALPIDPSLLLLPGLPLAEHAPPARAGVLGGLPPCRLPAVGGLPLDEHCLELGLSAAACEELGLGPVAEHAALSPAPGVAEATTTDLLAGLGHLLERMHLLELVLRRVLAEAECPVLGRAPRPGPPTTGLQHVRNAYASLAAERLRANASPGAPSSLQLQNIGDFTRLALHHAMESAANAVCGPASSAPGSGLIHQARCRGYLRVVSAHMVTAPPLGRQAPDPLAGNISTSFLQSNAWLQVVDHSDPALLMTSSLLGDVEAAIDHWLSGEVGVPQTSATSTSSSAITLVAESIADAFDLDVLLIVRPHWSLSNGLPWRVPLSRSMLAIGPLYPGHLDRFSWMELSVGGEPTAGPRRDVDESPIDATASDYLLDLDHGRGSVDLVVSLREPVSQIWEVAAEQGGPFAARGIPFGPQTGVCAVGLCNARKIAVPGFVPYTTRKGPILLSGFTPDDRARALHRPVVFASQSGSAHQLLADQIFGQPTSLGRVPVSPPTVFPPREAASYPDEDVPLPVTTRAVASSSVHGHRLAPIFAVGAGLADYGVLSCRDLDLANAYLARAGAMAGLLGMCEQTDRSVGGHLALSSGRVILPAHATEHDTMLVRDWAERQNATLTEAMLRHFDSMYPAPAGTSATNSATLAPGSRPLSPVAWAGVPAAVAAWWLPHAERLLAAAAGHPEAVAVFQPRFVPAAVLIPHYRHWTLTGMVALFSSLLYLFIMAVVVMIMVRVLRYSLRQFRGAVAARTGR